MVNRLRNFWRSRGRQLQALGGSDIQLRLAELGDPSSEMSQLWDRQHDLHVARRLLRLAESDFTEQTWDAFTKVAIEGQPTRLVAEKLGISTNAVLIAKSRVLSRLRKEAAGLVDSDSSILKKS